MENYLFSCSFYRAVFILALVITIAVVVTRNSDDDSDENMRNENPARAVRTDEFITLMQSFDGPITGN